MPTGERSELPVLAGDSDYRLVRVTPRSTQLALVDSRTGTVLPGRFADDDRWRIVVGSTVISPSRDGNLVDSTCGMSVAATDLKSAGASTGAVANPTNSPGVASSIPPTWTFEARTIRSYIGECLLKTQPPTQGTNLLVDDESGHPRLIDLRTGKPLWTAEVKGIGVALSESSVLIRDNDEFGGLAMLDASSGKVRWRAPDPMISLLSLDWRSAVTGKLAVVTDGADSATGVTTYDVATGQKLGHGSGSIVSAADNWLLTKETHPEGFDSAGSEKTRYTVNLYSY
jgi:hypothetical protein